MQSITMTHDNAPEFVKFLCEEVAPTGMLCSVKYTAETICESRPLFEIEINHDGMSQSDWRDNVYDIWPGDMLSIAYSMLDGNKTAMIGIHKAYNKPTDAFPLFTYAMNSWDLKRLPAKYAELLDKAAEDLREGQFLDSENNVELAELFKNGEIVKDVYEDDE